MTCEITDLSGTSDPPLMPARKYAAGLREIVARRPEDRISGRSLVRGAEFIEQLADEVERLRAGSRHDCWAWRLERDRLRAALASIAAFAPDEASTIDPHTQIATFARRTARGATGGGGGA
jgi:hypothetical protein